MKKATIVWLVIAAVLTIAGAAVFAGGMTMLNWDFSKLSLEKYETNTYEVSEGFDRLSIDVQRDDVVLQLSDDGSCKVVCHEQEKMKHAVAVAGKTLTIGVSDTREWYEHISLFSFDHPQMTVYLPKDRYAGLHIDNGTGDIDLPKAFTFTTIDIAGSTGNVTCRASSEGVTTIQRSTGDITVENASAGEFQLSVSTGEIRMNTINAKGNVSFDVSTGKAVLNDVSCQKDLRSTGSTGKATLSHVTASGSFTVERSTGDIVLDGCDAAELYLRTNTGSITGTLLSEKVFYAQSDIGRVNVPKTTSGGKCEVTTNTGNIEIALADKD